MSEARDSTITMAVEVWERGHAKKAGEMGVVNFLSGDECLSIFSLDPFLSLRLLELI